MKHFDVCGVQVSGLQRYDMASCAIPVIPNPEIPAGSFSAGWLMNRFSGSRHAVGMLRR